jgi:DNA polymerase-3 subunit beta
LIETAYQGETLTVGFNSQYLLEFFRAAGSGEIRLEFKDPQSAGQLRPDEPPDSEFKYRYIVMPMRI